MLAVAVSLYYWYGNACFCRKHIERALTSLLNSGWEICRLRRMACRGFWECLLKLLNFILTLTGLAMVGYGIYLFVGFTKASDDDIPEISPVSDDSALIQLGRPMLLAMSLSDSLFDKLPKAWYAYCSSPAFFRAYHWVRCIVDYLCDLLKVLFSAIFCCISLFSVV